VILEANNAGPTSAQMPGCRPLGETAVVRTIHARLQASFARAATLQATVGAPIVASR
jgi:hypothetical protein